MSSGRIVRAGLWSLLLVVLLTGILVFQIPPNQVILREGDVSPQAIRAPRKITFVSQIQTKAEQDKAEAQVADVYDPPDTKIARQQVVKARQVCDYIDTVRHDAYSTPEGQRALLLAIPGVSLSAKTIDELLRLNDQAWEAVANETPYVVDLAMRQSIRPDQLIEARRQVSSLVSLALPEEQASIVTELAKTFLVPNMFYNVEKTAEAKTQARQQVMPVNRTIEKGEIILREGDIVSPLHLEALEALGMRQTELRWQDAAGAFLFVALLVFILALYLARMRPRFWASERQMILLGLIIVLFAISAKAMIPAPNVLPYLLPIAAASMMLTVLLGTPLAIIVTFLLSLMVGFIAGGSLELIVYSLAGSVIASLGLWRVERLNAFLWAGGYVALVNGGVILAFRLPGQVDMPSLLTFLGAGLLNGALAASLTLAGFFLLGSLFGITTSLQLLDLARPTHPLFRQLLLKAPGTYHHSIVVSNLAERAAEQIGADALLVRVGAYYHDIGKTLRPYFFVENQVEGENIHDQLEPKTSAEIVIAHVKEGLELARKYNLPEEIQAFIPTHHGTGLAAYFHHKAMQSGGEIDEADFRYPGPKPQTQEEAILMLADGVEAMARANRPGSREEIEMLVQRVVDDRLLAGQLDECDLTLRDLEGVKLAFADILQGIFHPRIKYPEGLRSEKDKGSVVALPTKERVAR
jgi:putative nucleotidyltransferase with HDIG domain